MLRLYERGNNNKNGTSNTQISFFFRERLAVYKLLFTARTVNMSEHAEGCILVSGRRERDQHLDQSCTVSSTYKATGSISVYLAM